MFKKLLLAFAATLLLASPASAEFGETHKPIYWERYAYGSGYQVRLHNRTSYAVRCYFSFQYGDKGIPLYLSPGGTSIWVFTPYGYSTFVYNCNPI